jgi:hypothetical protein
MGVTQLYGAATLAGTGAVQITIANLNYYACSSRSF